MTKRVTKKYTWSEFQRTFFPESCERKRMDKIRKDPEKYGAWLAKKIVDDVIRGRKKK